MDLGIIELNIGLFILAGENVYKISNINIISIMQGGFLLDGKLCFLKAPPRRKKSIYDTFLH